MEKTTLVLTLSILLKEHAATFAQSQNRSLSEVVREALAQYTGYDLVAERGKHIERRGRPKKYNTDEERKEAARQRSRERDDLTRRLLEDHRRQQRQRDADILRQSLERKNPQR